MRWNSLKEWEVSEQLAHAPLIDESTFIAVQRVRAARPTKDGEMREYALAGLVVCGECGRRMDAHWVHGRPTTDNPSGNARIINKINRHNFQPNKIEPKT
ncbi:zinc ribbon domain-containing protein [Saccharopolyspora sp. 5N102]|uniref:zinc ribbon domain-containing protein n=1 Tax=Saccharopolyspora sp. 5N102 TaxID=3375155 RepID=UPI0037BD0535